MTDGALTGVSTLELERLLVAVERGTVACPLTEAALGNAGFAAPELAAALAALPRDAVVAALRIALAERRRPAPVLDLVWTGPEPRIATSRDTAVLVRELFERAERSVLIAGFAFDHGAQIFAPLHHAMSARGVAVEIFLDVRPPAPGVTPATHLRAVEEAFLRDNWPFPPPRPVLYYDPRTLSRDVYASLHAKCIVVDAARTLITSANFTDRGQSRNVELGVLVDDAGFGARVVAQWHGLVDAGLMAAVRGE